MKQENIFSKKLFSISSFDFKVEHLVLLVILLFGFFLRVTFLGTPTFWIDESISSIASLNILEKGVPVFDSGEFYDRALVFHYSQALSYIVFGVNDFSARFPSVLFGLLTIILAYLIGREFSPKAGLLSALFTSIFFLEVFFSMQARFYQLFQLAFFATIYFLYKSKIDPKWLLFASVSLIIAVDTQPAGLILTPFFLFVVLFYQRKKWLYSFVPIFVFVFEQFSFFSVTMRSAIVSGENFMLSYAESYLDFAKNMHYLLILSVYGIIESFLANRLLCVLLVVPSLIVLVGVFSLDIFAFRYAYFASFPIIVFFSLSLYFIWTRLEESKIILGVILLLIILPSNFLYPISYVTVLFPVSTNFGDYSAPVIDVKNIPVELASELKNPSNTLVTFFSPPVEWYLTKPDYIIPFSMDGHGTDSISVQLNDVNVGVYSGSPVVFKPNGKYYVIEEAFALSKLKPNQKSDYNILITNCRTEFFNSSIKVFNCN